MGLGATACTTSSSGSGDTKGGGNGRISAAMASDPTSLDPSKGTIAADLQMARMTYDSLVGRDDGGKVVPALAEKWDATSTKAEFTLKSGITCTDGAKLTASDVAASLNRFGDPKTGATAAAQVFGAGNTVTATGDDASRKVTVQLKNAWSDLLYGLAMPQASIICPAAMKDPDLLKNGGKGAGTGRYYLTKAQPGSVYSLTAHEGYKWGPQYAKQPAGKEPSGADMRVVQSEATMANEMQTGTLDSIGLTGADVARFTGKSGYKIEPAPIVRMMVVFNERKGHPGADPKVRKAMAAALDQKAFNQAVTRGSGQLMTSIADANVPCVSKDASLLTAYDKAAASKDLKGLKITVEGTNAVAGGAGNEYVQAALKAAGANVTLRNVANANWGTEVLGNKGDWDVTVLPNLNLTNLLTAPASLMSGPEPTAGRNFGNIQNPAFDKAFGKALSTTDETAKCAAWGDAQKALLTRNDVVPMAAVNVYYIDGSRILSAAPDGLYDPGTIRLKK
ncbi:ABC transporter substrate-binding protein [Streptomyces sp. NBC_01465]|uniref:ABC transporter substrate-binding protein n=1 Tax=Streptomyces sp. NBC_01465 TaxID=2903878 RepID=UPI002E2EADDD|nr:ABC transporter substrate-binding protein [Streptomyces sp. NBC_01465]